MHDALGTLERIGTPRVLVVGDVMLDRYTWGEAARVSPEAPVLVLRSDLDEVRPGGAASVAFLLAGLQARASGAGVVGQDADGRTLRRLLEESGIDHSLLLDDRDRVTTSKERIIGRAANHPHQLVRVDREDDRPIGRGLEDRLLAAIVERLPELDVLLISDYRKGVCSPRLLAGVIAAAADLGIPALVDPACDVDYGRYRGATLLKPNRLEAQIASGVTIRSANDALTAGRLLCERSRVETVLITLDAEGMALVPAGGKGELIATRPREVYDVTGAGDMALAMLGLCRAAGIGWRDAAYLANVAAGLEVERFGIAPVTRQEIRAALLALPSTSVGNALRGVPRAADADLLPLPRGEGRGEGGPRPAPPFIGNSPFDYDRLTRPCSLLPPELSRAPLPLDELLAHVAADRRAGRKIVFTNGCFDLLHVGHVRCLEEAAALGDVLIVAVNSDASVRRLKGPARPIVNQHDRATMVAALGCVDYVTIFTADTPHELIRAIKPNVCVKGGTSRREAALDREVVATLGGQMRITGRVNGVSTTRILDKIQTGRHK